jgi:hypothetical protein
VCDNHIEGTKNAFKEGIRLARKKYAENIDHITKLNLNFKYQIVQIDLSVFIKSKKEIE